LEVVEIATDRIERAQQRRRVLPSAFKWKESANPMFADRASAAAREWKGG